MRLVLGLVVGFVATTAAAQTAAQLRAASEILDLSGYREAVRAADSAYVHQMLRSSPEWQPFADILEEWSHKVYNWQAWRPIIIKRLTDTFTQVELDSLVAFFQANVGRKWAAMRVPLQAYLSELFVKTQVELRPALMEKLRARAAQLHRPLPPMRT
jgi:hypothetical protein